MASTPVAFKGSVHVGSLREVGRSAPLPATGCGPGPPPSRHRRRGAPKPRSPAGRFLGVSAGLWASGLAATTAAAAWRQRAYGGRCAPRVRALALRAQPSAEEPGPPFDADAVEPDAAEGADSFHELEGRLQAAVEREDFAEAARIRDVIRERSMGGELSIIAANRAFFEAIYKRDKQLMASLWHDGGHSCCIHQAQRPLHGRDAIMESWRQIFKRRQKKFDIASQSVVIRDNTGRVVVTSERVNRVVTNFYERTPEGWKLWFHQVGTITPINAKPSFGSLVMAVPKACVSALRSFGRRLKSGLGGGRAKPKPIKQPLRERELVDLALPSRRSRSLP